MKGQRFEPACRGGSLLVNETRVSRRGTVVWALWKSQIAGVGCVGAIEDEADTTTLSVHLRDGRRFVVEEIEPRECLRLFNLLGYEPEADADANADARPGEAPLVIELGDGHTRVATSTQCVTLEQDSHALWNLPRDRLVGVRVATREDVAEVQIVERDSDGMHLEGVPFIVALRLLVTLGAAPGESAPVTSPAARAANPVVAAVEASDAESLAAELVRDASSQSQVTRPPSSMAADSDERPSESSSAAEHSGAGHSGAGDAHFPGAAPALERQPSCNPTPAATVGSPAGAASPSTLGAPAAAPSPKPANSADTSTDTAPPVEHDTKPSAPPACAPTPHPNLQLTDPVSASALDLQAERLPAPVGPAEGADTLIVPTPPRRDLPNEGPPVRASTAAAGEVVTFREAARLLWHAVLAALAGGPARQVAAWALGPIVALRQLLGWLTQTAETAPAATFDGEAEPPIATGGVAALRAALGLMATRWRRRVAVAGPLAAVALMVTGALLFSDAVPSSLVRQGTSAQPPVMRGTLPAPASTGVVYAVSQDGAIDALDARSGALLWRYNTGSPVEGGPVVADGVIYAGEGDGSIVALQAATHQVLWRYHTGGSVRAAPAVVNGVVYASSSDHHLYALRANDGALLWRFAVGDQQLTGTPAVADGTVYASTSDGTLYALGASNGRLRWRYPTYTRSDVAPVAASQVVRARPGGVSGSALEAQNGVLRSRFRAHGHIALRPTATLRS